MVHMSYVALSSIWAKNMQIYLLVPAGDTYDMEVPE